jgi:glutathione synthase/RimK-type ligase-like ATP-grasp enzyme
MILILSNKWDISVDFVVRELRKRDHPFLRLNTEDLISKKATITLPEIHIHVTKQDRSYDLSENVRVIWNRRPGNPFDDSPLAQKPPPATQKYMNDQWYTWLEALQLLPNMTWINHPETGSRIENKIRQLWLASRLGFSIPNTIISNDPDAARLFLKNRGGRVIAKALYAPLIQEPEQDYFIFANQITEVRPEHDDEIKVSPIIFQEPIVPKVDYRVTVVGDVVMPVRIEPGDQGSVALDWRTQKDGLRFRQCDLPVAVERLCRAYVKECGLLFGAIDLVERNDDFVFLEINQNGEWGWLQKPNGLPIAETLCDLMIMKDHASPGGPHDDIH